MPQISVIIPTYNRRIFLREAVNSVQKQTWQDLEIIIIDDGSRDGTIADWRDQKEVIYRYQKNRGVSAARNHGLRLARGQYICFLDSDDLWHKEKLARQLAIMESQKQIAAVYTGEAWYRNGRWLNQKKHHRKYSGRIFKQTLPLCIISPSSIMLRPHVVKSIGFFDERLPVCEDYDYWLRLTARYPVFFLADRLIIKRGGHADQLSRRAPAMDQYRLRALGKAWRSPDLSASERRAAQAAGRDKRDILLAGARKRGRWLFWLRWKIWRCFK